MKCKHKWRVYDSKPTTDFSALKLQYGKCVFCNKHRTTYIIEKEVLENLTKQVEFSKNLVQSVNNAIIKIMGKEI